MIMTDFECGLRHAINQEFSNARHRGCYFHYTQALIREVQRLGLMRLYRENRDFQSVVRQLLSLEFLPVLLVELAFDELVTRASATNFPSDTTLELFIYYRNYWIETVGVRMYNVHNEIHRTNNALESWHSRFNKVVGRHHPNIYMLFQFLIQEQVQTENHVGNIELGRSVNYTPAKTKRIDKQIALLVHRFDSGEMDEVSFLKSIGYCLHSGLRTTSLTSLPHAKATPTSLRDSSASTASTPNECPVLLEPPTCSNASKCSNSSMSDNISLSMSESSNLWSLASLTSMALNTVPSLLLFSSSSHCWSPLANASTLPNRFGSLAHAGSANDV